MDLIYLAHPVRPLEGSAETVESNLRDAEWWFGTLQYANPGVAFSMDWCLELRLKVGRDEVPEERAAGIARNCWRAARCTGIALCGPRISSGKLDETRAVAFGSLAPIAVHRFRDRSQDLVLPPRRDLLSVWMDDIDRTAPRWMGGLRYGAFPQSAELVAHEILDAERRYREVRS